MRILVLPSHSSTTVTALRGTALTLVIALALCLSNNPLFAEGTAKRQPDATGAGDTKPSTPIPKIPKNKLPLATGKKPDPRNEQYQRGRVSVSVEEFVQPERDEAYEPKVPLLQIYLAEYFRRAGFDVTDDRDVAEFSIVGFFEASYVRTLTFKDQRFALQFEASAGVKVKDATGRVLGEIDVPRRIREAALMAPRPKSAVKKDEISGPPQAGDGKREKADIEKGVPKQTAPPKDGRSRSGGLPTKRAQEAELIRDFRREYARIIWQDVFRKLTPIADPEIPSLIDSLTVDDFEAPEPVDGDAVVKSLVARRLAAVPYLLDAMSDERPVLVQVSYPGLTPLNAEKLRVFHLADKALENIFQKVSRMNLDSPDEHRFIIIKAWEYEWRRFCRSYKESPSSPARKSSDSPKRKRR